MKTKKTTIISFAVAMVLVTGTVTVFATSAKGDESSTVTEATDTTNTTFSDTVDTETIMSYINPDDGKTYYVQVGAFKSKANAEKYLEGVKKNYPNAFIKTM